FFFASRRRHTSFSRDWSSDVCSSDLLEQPRGLLLRQLDDRDPGRDRQHLGDQLLVDLGDLVHVAGAPLLLTLGLAEDQLLLLVRSEERRVGKGGTSRWSRERPQQRRT